MKFFLLFITGSAVIFVIFLMIISSTIKSMAKCVSSYNDALDNNTQTAIEESLDKSDVCANAKKTVLGLQKCYDAAELQNIITPNVIFNIEKSFMPKAAIGDVSEIIKYHNASCENYPDAQIP